MKINFRADTAQVRALMDDLQGRFSDKEIRDALMPAAGIYKTHIEAAAPVDSGLLQSKGIVVRKMRKGPVVIVAADRKRVKRKSKSFPNGFPYVNSVVSEKRRGAKADKFVARGAEAAESAATAQAISDLRKLAKIRGLL
jgi:hypothetical protein